MHTARQGKTSAPGIVVWPENMKVTANNVTPNNLKVPLPPNPAFFRTKVRNVSIACGPGDPLMETASTQDVCRWRTTSKANTAQAVAAFKDATCPDMGSLTV